MKLVVITEIPKEALDASCSLSSTHCLHHTMNVERSNSIILKNLPISESHLAVKVLTEYQDNLSERR